ncbi:MAG: hypothetical protein M1816_001680 [Peltula sp. TS41687]|nr:MAG: hypothetical protein M1816_001680 [Peltula sp. TS41687]
MTDIAVARSLHRAIRALRDSDQERRKVTAQKDVHQPGMVQQANTDTTRDSDASTTTATTRLDDQLTCEERDAILLSNKSSEEEGHRRLNWVPYIHFGVQS